jgi:aspartyl aminopeptidase
MHTSFFDDSARRLLDFIKTSPTPWHAVNSAEHLLRAQDYQRLHESEPWPALSAGSGYYVIRGGSSLVAFRPGTQPPARGGFLIVGAHTDSPGLRIKPKMAQETAPLTRLGVEVYGSPILATYTDRDLGLSGRVFVATASGIESRLLRCPAPLLRLPNLAIHLNRGVNEEGLKLNRQTELPLLFGHSSLIELLAHHLGCEPQAILSWELLAHDTQPGIFWGAGQEFIAASQLDNLGSCHAALEALLNPYDAAPSAATLVVALFDHEEIGSETAVGAMSSLLGDTLERITLDCGDDRTGYKQALARSFMVSADAAHAWHPNHAGSYDADHALKVNGGPAIKINANRRYASDGYTVACFVQVCERAGVPHQKFVQRSDLGCGSTIGPMTAAKLGIATVDVGAPIWAMHSIRESGGALDPVYLTRALHTFFYDPPPGCGHA